MIVTEGAITDRPLPRTFAAIAARGFTGELIVTSAGRESGARRKTRPFFSASGGQAAGFLLATLPYPLAFA